MRFDPSQGHNLLIWRKKELENVFLAPDWLAHSQYRKSGFTAESLREEIRTVMQGRLWPELVKRVLAKVRFELKAARRKKGKDQEAAPTSRAEAEAAVVHSEALVELRKRTGLCLSESKLRERFDAEVQVITGGLESLCWGTGRWLELLSGKGALKSLINSHFRVPAKHPRADGTHEALAVDDALVSVAEDLFTHHQKHMPQDFHDLMHKLAAVG